MSLLVRNDLYPRNSHRNQQRIAFVEHLRVIACLMVISIHVRLPIVSKNNTIDSERLLYQCCVADANTIFWMITGFLLMEKSRYYQTIRMQTDRVFWPTQALTLVWFYIEPAVIYGKSRRESLLKAAEAYRELKFQFDCISINLFVSILIDQILSRTTCNKLAQKFKGFDPNPY